MPPIAKADLPAIDVTPLQGKFLELLVRVSGARRMLEIGTLGGYSTIWLARASACRRHVVTLELEPHHAKIARENLETRRPARPRRTPRRPRRRRLRHSSPSNAAPFDFIFIDADKSGYPDYLNGP